MEAMRCLKRRISDASIAISSPTPEPIRPDKVVRPRRLRTPGDYSWQPCHMHHGRLVVAVTLWHGDRIALLRRSSRVTSDPGLWHCVTGYLGLGSDPSEQALLEVLEETGVSRSMLSRFEPAPTVRLHDDANRVWTIHRFAAETMSRRLELNWEHDAYAWVAPKELPVAHVLWLPRAIARLGRTCGASNTGSG
jgi:8-oxo-dGTP pyrophosphatase MutT (NUDIX family)